MDKNLKIVCDQDLFIKSAKSDDTFYIVPAIVGGGGKRGNMLLLAALAVALPGIGSMMSGGSFAAGYGAATATGAGLMSGGGIVPHVAGEVGMSSFGASLGSTFSTIGVNAGLALVTSLFTERPKNIKQTDQNIRTNDMFGSLQNTIDSGVPIPLIYGMHRVTGQLISGYLDTVDHGKEDIITVGSRFTT